MNKRFVALCGVLVATAFGAGAYLVLRDDDDASRPPTAHTVPAAHKPQLGPAVLAEIKGYIAAEASRDPARACLDYPDPPEAHWNRPVVEAFCHQLERRAYTFQAVRKRLDEHQADALRDIFDGYVEQNYRPGQHGYMIWAYARTFAYPNHEVGALAEQWLREDPDSAPARIARGLHRVAAAYQARGEKFSSDTTAEQFANSHRIAEQARVDLQAALARNPKLIVADYGLIRLARLESDHALLESATRHALALDPSDQFIFDAWREALDPKWGGSAEAMQAVAKQAIESAGENPLLDTFRVRDRCEQAEKMICSTCGSADSLRQRAQAALQLYVSAVNEAPAECTFGYGAYSATQIDDPVSAIRFYSQGYRFSAVPNFVLWRAQVLQGLGQGELALASLDHLAERQPGNPEAQLNRGYVLDQMHRANEAERAFAAALAIDPVNWDARRNLVHVYADELQEPAKAQAIIAAMNAEKPRSPRVWLLEASLHKHGEERQCRDALRQYLSEVDPATTDPVDLREIERVKQRLSELDKLVGP